MLISAESNTCVRSNIKVFLLCSHVNLLFFDTDSLETPVIRSGQPCRNGLTCEPGGWGVSWYFLPSVPSFCKCADTEQKPLAIPQQAAVPVGHLLVSSVTMRLPLRVQALCQCACPEGPVQDDQVSICSDTRDSCSVDSVLHEVRRKRGEQLLNQGPGSPCLLS